MPTATSATSPGWPRSGSTTTRSSSIDARGRAALLRRAETDLIVRYQSQVVSTRLATPDQSRPEVRLRQAAPGGTSSTTSSSSGSKSLKVPPSPPAADATFLRRVSLDLTGEQPTPEQVRKFLADHRPREADQAGRRAARQRATSSGSGRSSWATCSRSAPARIGNGALQVPGVARPSSSSRTRPGT